MKNKLIVLIVSALVGGFIFNIWATLSHMALPIHTKAFVRFTNEAEVAEVIQKNAPVNGTYGLFPSMPNEPDNKVKGVFVSASVRQFADGTSLSSGSKFVSNLLLTLLVYIIGALIITKLLLKTKGLNYWMRVGTIVMMAVLIFLLGQATTWIWYGASNLFYLADLVDLIVGWFLAGLVISKLVEKVYET